MHWIFFSIIATIALGISMSLYKMPSFKEYSSFFSTFWSNVFAGIVVIVIIAIFDTHALAGLQTISWLALAWGVCFAITMVLQKLLLAHAESNAVYPVTSSLGSIVTILIGVTVLSERIAPIQALGTAIILLSVYLFTKKGGGFRLTRTTMFLALGIITSSTLSKYIQKFGATHDSVTHFMLWQFLGAALFALLIAYIFEKKSFRDIVKLSRYWKGSVLIGCFTALGAYAIFLALSTGPLSGVFAIHPSYTIIAGLFAFLFFGERLTWKKVTLALLSILGVLLIRFG